MKVLSLLLIIVNIKDYNAKYEKKLKMDVRMYRCSVSSNHRFKDETSSK